MWVQRLLEATRVLRIMLPEGATVLEATLRVLPVPVYDPHFSQKFRPQQSGHSEQSSVESWFKRAAAPERLSYDCASASNTSVGSSICLQNAEVRVTELSRHWGFLDGPVLGGRPVFRVKVTTDDMRCLIGPNWRENSCSDATENHGTRDGADREWPFLVLRYALPRWWILYKPLLLAVILFTPFAVVIFMSRWYNVMQK